MSRKVVKQHIAFLTFFCLILTLHAQEKMPLFGVFEVAFEGSMYSSTDNPVRDVELLTTWQHESGKLRIQIHGYFDGDGQGQNAGRMFKVRFCPTEVGQWELIDVHSNDELLNQQKTGLRVICEKSANKGFWMPDEQNGNRWYVRSNGDHPYIIGNTFYTFLSEYFKGQPSGGNIATDVRGNAKYLNKLRFAVTGDIFPNPVEKPFLDEEGKPTDNGRYSHRPNAKWFSERVDQAVQLCFEQDVIADIILNGPDSEDARSALSADANGHDHLPYLRYIAARYGSYPNVWICLSNEFDIKKPKFSLDEIVDIGSEMKALLPYSTPLSVHGDQGNWKHELNKADWNDHVIIQNKIKYLPNAAHYMEMNYWIGDQKPVVNDELAYEGKADGWSEEDVIEAVLGAFMGGGYASSGYKPIRKGGHYFAGNFNANEHRAIDNMLWFRQTIDQNIRFWQMEPIFITEATYKDGIDGSRSSIFFQLDKDFRVLEWANRQYVLATNKEKKHMLAYLPEGTWQVRQYDLLTKKETTLAEKVTGTFEFSSPDSRAVMIVVTLLENEK